MKKVRLIACFLLICVCFGALYSCKSKDTLTLNSKYFNELEAKEVDPVWLRNWMYSSQTNCYNGPLFTLNEIQGELYLEKREEKSTHRVCLSGYYFVGIDNGEFGGGVAFLDYYSGEELSVKVLSEENCCGFLQPKAFVEYADGDGGYWSKDPESCYVFTGLAHMLIDRGKIYKLSLTEDGYSFDEFADLGSQPNAFVMDGDNIIVATTKALLSVDPEGNITELYAPDYWTYFWINSMVKKDGCYYMGSSSGILKFIPETKEAVWYPYYNTEE